MCINAVDGSLDELLLQVTQPLDVFLCAGDLDLGLTSDDSQASAWCVEEHAVELLKDGWQFATIVGDDDCVVNTEAVQVGVE